MPSYLDLYMPYDSGLGANVTESGWRKFAKYFCQDGVRRGVANGFNTFGDSTGMQVKVDTGECVIQGQWGQSTAIKAIPITSNSSGSNRLDLIVLRNDFINNDMVVDVLTGSSPTVKPNLTQNTSIWEVQLAIVTVPNGAVTIASANVQFLPLYTDGSALFRANTTGATGPTITSGNETAVPWLWPTNLSSAVHQSAQNVTTNCGFTFDRAGMWIINYSLEYQANSTNSRWGWIARSAAKDALRLGQISTQSAASGFTTVTGSAMDRFNAGEEVAVYAFQDSGVSLLLETQYDSTVVSFYWLGP